MPPYTPSPAAPSWLKPSSSIGTVVSEPKSARWINSTVAASWTAALTQTACAGSGRAGSCTAAVIHGGSPAASALLSAPAVWPAAALQARQLRAERSALAAAISSSDGPRPSGVTGHGGESA